MGLVGRGPNYESPALFFDRVAGFCGPIHSLASRYIDIET
jgi:hypothetical protein